MGVLNYNGALYLATGIDNSGLKRDASEAERIIEGLGSAAKKVGQMMGVAFTLDAAKDFAVKVATVRGEFQKLEVAFKNMLGNKEAADRLMQQLTRTAATTPFGMQEVAGGAKQLLAYGVAANDVNDTLVRLGNIASGLSIPLNDLVYLYGTTMTQGRLFTQDLRQFMGRGIPIADELAKQFGVTKDQVQSLVEAGKVGFPEVQKALESLTNEGGKFYNLMEEQSKTIAGKMSNLSDAIEMMFNDIGKSQEGVIAKALDGVTSLVENYKQIGSVLAQLVIAYGAYKASLIAVTTAKSVYTKTNAAITDQMALEQRLALSMGKEITESEARQAAQTKLLSTAKAGLVANLKNVATALAPNLYAAAIVAVGALAKALYDMASEASGAEKAVQTLNRVTQEAEEEAEKERAKIDLLIAIIKDENTVRSAKEKALRDLYAIAPDILGDITMEMIATGKYIPVVERLTAALRAKNQAERESDEIAQSRARVKAIQNDAKNGTSDRSFFHRFLAGVTTVGQSVSGMPVNGRTYEDQYDKLTKERNKKRLRNELDFQMAMTQNAVKSTNEPDKRFRRVRNAEGKLVMSQPMKDYHPGRGVYRSSYMNALRVGATETNIAYHESDHQRWQSLDFVLGVKVERSGTSAKPCPVCDAMKGTYPKGFKFLPWHPFCICHAMPVMLSGQEFTDYLVTGRMPDGRVLRDMPASALEYVEQHPSYRTSYAYQHNVPFFDKTSAANTSEGGAPTKPARPAKTEAQKADIQKRWNTRVSTNSHGVALDAIAEDFSDVPSIAFLGGKVSGRIAAGADPSEVDALMARLRHKIEVKKAWEERRELNRLYPHWTWDDYAKAVSNVRITENSMCRFGGVNAAEGTHSDISRLGTQAT